MKQQQTIETEVMVLNAEELIEEIIGLVCEQYVLPSDIVIYFDDDSNVRKDFTLFEELAKAEIPFVISFCSVCYASGVKFVPWKYRSNVNYGTEYAYLWQE